MGLFKKIKRIVKGTVRKVENVAHQVAGKPKIGEKEPSLDEGARSAAAKRLINTQKQAGAGQIAYNTEEEV